MLRRMPSPAAPRRVREITPEWLNAALAAGDHLGSARVRSVDVADIGAGVGFAGRALRLDIGYDRADGSLPASMVLKLPSPDAGGRETINAMRGYELEGRFYERLATGTPMRVPACYWSAVDIEGGDYGLLLEYLDGLRTGDQAASCTAEEAEAIVRALATMHAAWWESEELRASAWLPPFEETGAVWQQRSVAGLQPFIDTNSDWLPAGFAATAERIIERLGELQAATVGSPRTLVHGDYRLENMMFADPAGEDSLVIIDWQLIGYGPGAYDLAYFIGQSLTVELRRSSEARLLELYRETLAAAGVHDYSAEQLAEDYRRGLLAAMRIPLTGSGEFARVREEANRLSGAIREGYDAALQAGDALMQMIAERNVAAIVDTSAAELLRA
jgi:aminoglycoside phosphotransferase (APT) family kinase protein